jgi:hypothetical protein
MLLDPAFRYARGAELQHDGGRLDITADPCDRRRQRHVSQWTFHEEGDD